MIYILRFGEITLKGKNRSKFEDKLKGNIAKTFGELSFQKGGGRFYIEGPEGLDFRKTFGIVSYSPAERTSLDYDKIENKVIEMCRGHDGSFAIDTSRPNKQYGMTSMEMNQKLGAAVVEKYGLEVDLDNPDLKIGVEITKKHVYAYNQVFDCFGGLPVGIEGKVAAIVEDEKSILAALLMMKRGCEVIPVGSVDISLLKHFGCEQEIQEALPGDVRAVVVGDTLKEFKEYGFPEPVMRPLIGFDEEMIKEKLQEYESVC